ncbi:MAG: hypothetical protein IIA82_09645 [Thaumarchaeota archaeon]|nr:hypothetical protein [Nitrososphaerota archaeon]
MAKTKTASVRLPKEMYEEIDNICDEVGCSRNDWIKDTLQNKLREENNQNSQDQEVIEDTKPPKITARLIDDEPKKERKDIVVNFNPKDSVIEKVEPKATVEITPIPKIEIKEVIQDNSNKSVVQFTQFNDKLLPVAKRFNI